MKKRIDIDSLVFLIVSIGIVTLILAGIGKCLAIYGSAFFLVLGIFFILLGQWLRTKPMNKRESCLMWTGFKNIKNWEKKCRLTVFSGLFLIFCGCVYSLWYVFISPERALLVSLLVMMVGIITKTVINYKLEKSEKFRFNG